MIRSVQGFLEAALMWNMINVATTSSRQTARNFLMFIVFATLTILLGGGYYNSLRSGELTIKGRTSRRTSDPISYWFGMVIGTLVFLVSASLTAVLAFLLWADLVGF